MSLIVNLLFLFGTVLADVHVSVSPSSSKMGRVGKVMTLVCSIESDSAALTDDTDLAWYRGVEQLDSARVPIPGNFSLTLENPQFNDSDLYTCGAEEHGLLDTVSLRFGAPPSIPKTSGQNCTNSQDVLVFWETKYNDTNLPTIYKFEYKTEVNSSRCPGSEYSPCPNSEKGTHTCFLEKHHYCSQIDYRITAINALGNESHEVSFHPYFITIPNSPTNLEFIFNEVWEIRWEIPFDWPYGNLNELWYWLQYWSEEENIEFVTDPADPLENTFYQLKNNLDPFTLYYVSVAAKYHLYDYINRKSTKADEGWGKPVIGNFTTEEVQPNGRFIFNISDISLSSEDPGKVNVFLQWEPMSKEESGGIIRGYNISILLNEVEYWNIQLNGIGKEYRITDQLDKLYYKNYSIRVVAFNHKGSVSYEISLSEYPLPISVLPPNESAIIAAAVVVCIGLIAIVLVSILSYHFYKTIKEAQNIPDVPTTIAAELVQDSDGYMHVNETGHGQRGQTTEVFDIVIPEEDWQREYLKENTLKHEKHIEMVVLPSTSGTSDHTEVPLSR